VERRKSKNKWVVVTDYGDFTSSTGTVETDIFLRNSLYPHDEEASDDEAQDTPDHERASHNGPRSDYKRSINGPGSDRKRSLNGPRVQHQPQESQRPGSAKRQKAIKVMSAGLTVHERDRGRSQSRPSTLWRWTKNSCHLDVFLCCLDSSLQLQSTYLDSETCGSEWTRRYTRAALAHCDDRNTIRNNLRQFIQTHSTIERQDGTADIRDHLFLMCAKSRHPEERAHNVSLARSATGRDR
jgi:hypothetical protein